MSAALAHLLTIDDADSATIEHSPSQSNEHAAWKSRSRSQAPKPELQLGARFGKFELMEEAGRGSFGVVYRAKDTEADRMVALKVPLPNRARPQAESEATFLREAFHGFGLAHPAIVATLEAGRIEETWYLASELIDGVTLEQDLAERDPDCRVSARLLAEIADAVQHAHDRGVIHRDLKPANILIDRAGRPHIADFGLSQRASAQPTAGAETRIVGTPAYMSPEQAAGDSGRPDARNDVYSLGVMLYQLLAGRLPFEGSARALLLKLRAEEPPSPRSFDPRIPSELDAVCRKAMAKSPSDRYPSAKEMARDLRRFLGEVPAA